MRLIVFTTIHLRSWHERTLTHLFLIDVTALVFNTWERRLSVAWQRLGRI